MNRSPARSWTFATSTPSPERWWSRHTAAQSQSWMPPVVRSSSSRCSSSHDLDSSMAGNAQLLLDEFDAFIAGRGIERQEDYLALRRRGGGSGLGRGERERVWAAFTDYRETLRKRRAWDWPHIRLEALRLAEAGGGPRYDGVEVPRFGGQGLIGLIRRYCRCCRRRTVRNPKGYAQFCSFSRARSRASARRATRAALSPSLAAACWAS